MLYIGTNHFDLDGPEKLERILRQYRKCTITLEQRELLSLAETYGFYTDLRKMLRCSANEIGLFSTSERTLLSKLSESFGYEFIIPFNLMRKRNNRLVLIDNRGTGKVIDSFNYVTENVQHSLKNLPPYSTIDPVEWFKMRITIVCQDKESLDGYLKHAGCDSETHLSLMNYVIGKSNYYMASRIKEIKPEIHIGGAAHISECYYPPLQVLAGTPDAERIFL